MALFCSVDTSDPLPLVASRRANLLAPLGACHGHKAPVRRSSRPVGSAVHERPGRASPTPSDPERDHPVQGGRKRGDASSAAAELADRFPTRPKRNRSAAVIPSGPTSGSVTRPRRSANARDGYKGLPDRPDYRVSSDAHARGVGPHPTPALCKCPINCSESEPSLGSGQVSVGHKPHGKFLVAPDHEALGPPGRMFGVKGDAPCSL